MTLDSQSRELTAQQTVLGLIATASIEAGVEEARIHLEKIGLFPEHFSDPALRDLYSIEAALLLESRPVTPLSVTAVGAGNKRINTKLFAETLNVSNNDVLGSLPHLAEQLKTAHSKRRLQKHYLDSAERLMRPGCSVSEIVGDSRQFLDDCADSLTAHHWLDEKLAALQEEFNAFESGIRAPIISSGVAALDKIIGGFEPTLTIIGGLPGAGKSALIATILGSLGERNIKCGFFGLEDGTDWVLKRLISREANFPIFNFFRRQPNHEEKARLQAAAGTIANVARNIAEHAPIDEMKPGDLVAKAKDWILNHGVKIIFIDHLGELDHGGENKERHDLSIKKTIKSLRGIAIQNKVPVVVVAHLKNEYEKQARGGDAKPLLSQFAESAYIGRMARLALGVSAGSHESLMNISILKFQSGRAGLTLEIPRVMESALVDTRKGGIVVIKSEDSQ